VSADRAFWLVGLSHHSAPIALREQLAGVGDTLEGRVRKLLEVPGVSEGAFVSTCNRVEIMACTDRDSAGEELLREFLAEEGGLSRRSLDEHVYAHHGRAAVHHLFRVASSLDSMVVGEPQILGQLKQFYKVAADTGGARTILHRVFHKAFSVAKRVRTETGIGGLGVSIPSLAVDLASQIFETLGDKTAMVVGAGKMSELTARHLRGRGVGGIMFANRTFDRAVALAREQGGTPVSFAEWKHYLKLADVVIGSTSAAGFLLTAEEVQQALRERSYRPMFLIDLAVPRNFDPQINAIDNVYLYDIDDLEGVRADNEGAREREAVHAEEIVEQEVDIFWRWFQGLELTPTIVGLREQADEVRRVELERMLRAHPELDEQTRNAVEAMSEAIVNKLLHRPIAEMKRSGPQGVSVLRRLFGLGDDELEERDGD
jgi:glutamyl-tRNA reductase